MSEYGLGAFHVHYTGDDGTEYRKAFRTWTDADKMRNFLEALGIYPAIDMHKKKKDWE